MDEKNIAEILEKNVANYYDNKLQIASLGEKQEELKEQNLKLVKMLGLKKGDSIIFDKISLQIQLIEMIKKDRADEDGLIEAYGAEKINGLKVLPVAIVEAAIKAKKLPPEAEDFIIKKPPVEYTKVTPVAKVYMTNTDVKIRKLEFVKIGRQKEMY